MEQHENRQANLPVVPNREEKDTVRSYYLIRILRDYCKSGDAFISEEKLYNLCRQKYSRLTYGRFRGDLAEQIRLKGISREGSRLYLSRILRYENAVAHMLERILEDNELPAPNVPDNLKVNGLTLTAEQCTAVRVAVSHRLSVILGGAGCGKTTLIEAIVNSCPGVDPDGGSFVLCAPTGKAACVLAARTGLPARTVHSALKKIPEDDFLALGAVEWGGVKLVIIDEASMMSLELLAGVLHAARSNCQIVLVGDPNQLLSVGAGNVLPDLIALGLPQVVLETCHRQENGNSALAYNVRNFSLCRRFSDLRFDDSFVFVPVRSEEEIQARICTEAAALYQGGTEVQVLAPVNNGTLSVEDLNLDLQDRVNPATTDNRIPDSDFRNDDRVIVTKNDWDQHVCNGDVGRFVYTGSGDVFSFRVICSGGRSAGWDDKRCLNLIRLAYAMTAHKSQGSEFGTVVLGMTNAYRTMLYRNLFYTAISRARRKVILIGDPGALDAALQKEAPARKSMLVAKVRMQQHQAHTPKTPAA